jgi:SAM-dependent methyltransferase
MYPEPIRDLPAWLAGNWQWFDPSHAHRMFWPDRDYRPDLDILIAGCGTNQAAVFAYTNPGATVVAIDVSGPSLDHHRFLKEKYGLKNLELHQLPIEAVATLGRYFDLIVSTGVLHHLADPNAGMQTLADCLRPDGVAAIMLYARYGRIGVEMLQATFRELGLRQDEASISIVRAVIASLPQDHPVKSYMAVAPDLQFDAGLVDTFLHGRDRSYTVPDCLDLVRSAGLVFQEWFIKSPYYPPAGSDHAFYAAVAGLPEERQWSLMEKVNTRNGCHFFTACRPDRPRETYRVDFTAETFLDRVPMFRYRCGFRDGKVFRSDWTMALDVVQQTLIRQVDGRRTLREIIAATGQATFGRSPADFESAARTFFRSLVERDFLSMGLPGPHWHGARMTMDYSADEPRPSVQDTPPLRQALTRRVLRRTVASGQIRLPAVPAMLEECLAMCLQSFAALGVTFNAQQVAELRMALEGQLGAAFAASPRSEVVVTYDSPVGLTVNWQVKPQWSTVDASYDTWVTTRQPPYFGTAPDARVMALATEAASPDTCPALDLGAGTGRNALALARRGHAVDAVEMAASFAAILRTAAAQESLSVLVLERDLFATRGDLRRDYGLVLLSEVVSDFRTTTQLRQMFEVAAACLAPGGRLVFNAFLPRIGYEPDEAARQFGQQAYTSIFTYAEMAAAAAGLPLAFVADDSAHDYEQQNLPDGAWPPTSWYADWASGLDVFDVPRHESPIELRWLVFEKTYPGRNIRPG